MKFGYITALSTAQKNLTEDSNYSNLYIASNVDDQSQVQNRDVRIKNSKPLDFDRAAIELGSRYLERFAKAPIEIGFCIEMRKIQTLP